MQDQDKTREELIDELNEMRRKVADIGNAGKAQGVACLIDDITHSSWWNKNYGRVNNACNWPWKEGRSGCGTGT